MGHLGRAGNSEEAEEAVHHARERDVFAWRR
jgi:pentatricopeptide repeat protein